MLETGECSLGLHNCTLPWEVVTVGVCVDGAASIGAQHSTVWAQHHQLWDALDL